MLGDTHLTYNLTLNHNEDADPIISSTFLIEPNAQLSITCTRDDNFDSPEFSLKRNEVELGMMDSKRKKITHYIHNYTSSQDGVYFCESRRPDGVYHFRQLRLSSKGKLPKQKELCGDKFPDRCGNHGVCVWHGGQPTCYCHKGYEGSQCEISFVSDSNNTSYSTGSVVTYATRYGAYTSYFVLILLFFAICIWTSRKKPTGKKYASSMTSQTQSAVALTNSSVTIDFHNPSDLGNRQLNPEAPGRDIRRDNNLRKNFSKKKGSNKTTVLNIYEDGIEESHSSTNLISS